MAELQQSHRSAFLALVVMKYHLFMQYEGYYKLKRPEMRNKYKGLPLNTLIHVLSNKLCHRIFGSQPTPLV